MSVLAVLPLAGLSASGEAAGVTIRVLPDSLTLTVVPATAALVGALFALVGVARGVGRSRAERLLLAGNLVGAAVGLAAFMLAVALHGFS